MLVLLGGLPGVGKSVLADGLARRLGAVVVSVDPIEDAMLRSGIAMSFETGVAAYAVGATIAAAQLRNGLDVIADAANYLEVGRDVWRRAAEETGSPTKVIAVVCSDEGVHRERLQARGRELVAYPEPTWDDVLLQKDETEPWTGDVLTVDTIRPLDELLDAAVAYLEA